MISLSRILPPVFNPLSPIWLLWFASFFILADLYSFAYQAPLPMEQLPADQCQVYTANPAAIHQITFTEPTTQAAQTIDTSAILVSAE